jgi:Predicted membrane protein (DUF2232)
VIESTPTPEPAATAFEGRHARWEIPLAAGLSALFFAAFLVVPIVGALGFPFAAVPLIRVTYRKGPAAGLIATGLAAAILFGLVVASAGWREALNVGTAAALVTGLPVFFSARVRRGADPSRSFLAASVTGCLLLTGILLTASVAGQPPVAAELRSIIDGMIPAALDSYRRANADASTLERVRTTLIAARDFTERYWAGLLVACWVLAAAVTFYVGAWAARPAEVAQRIGFERLRVPAAWAGLFVAAGAGFPFLEGLARTAAGDILLALAALYFVAGLSIICHFARKWFRARVLRFGLYALVAYFPMNVGVALVGLFDWYVNFRRRGEKEETR